MSNFPALPAGMGWPFVDDDTGEFQSTAVKGWLSATIAEGAKAPDQGQGFAAKYRLRTGNLAVGLAGDSTGNNGDEWFEGLMIQLGKNDPALRVEMHRWNAGTDGYDAVAVLQAGTDGRVLSAYNGSISGSVLAGQIPHLPTMFPVPLDFLFVSSSHNYGSQSLTQYEAALDSFVAAFRGQRPEAGLVFSSQNPEKPPATTPYSPAGHLARQSFLRGYAQRNRFGYVPVTEGFLDRVDWEALIQADGVHPTIGLSGVSGSTVWRDVAAAYLNGLGATPSGYAAPPAFGPGQWVYTASPTATATGLSAQGTMRVVPWRVERRMTVRGLAAEVTTAGEAGSKVRVAIFADKGDSTPGALIAESGALPGDGVGMISAEFSEVALNPGLYWVGAVAQLCPTTPPFLRGIGAGWVPPVPMAAGASLPVANSQAMGYQGGGVTGAVPATFPTGGQTTYAARCLIRCGL